MANQRVGIPVIGIQGEVGSFSHLAAKQLMGNEMDLLPTRGFDELFEAVASGTAHQAVVPVENTLAGPVPGNLDRILRHGFHVRAETRVRIRLTLVGVKSTPVDRLTRVASHPVALAQCTRFFRAHPFLEPVPVYDTAGSIRDLMAKTDAYDAAVGSPFAAHLYGAVVLKEEIEDDPGNFTRFFLVGREKGEPPTAATKTSLAFVVPHRPGSLHRALGVFAGRGLDLTKLESRPIPGRAWEYRFFADVRTPDPGEMEDALRELGSFCSETCLLGSYPEAPDGRK